jgi:hypothetical protein
VQHLLGGDEAINDNKNILYTERVSVSPSDYQPPRSLASDYSAWEKTRDDPYCKQNVRFPWILTRWASAATRGAFGVWMEEEHGFSVYMNVLAGSVWVVISKLKKKGRRIITKIRTAVEQIDLAESNLHEWDVEAIFLEEGSQL